MNDVQMQMFFEEANARALQAEKLIRETKPFGRPAKNYADEISQFKTAQYQTYNNKSHANEISFNCTQILTKRHSCDVVDYQRDLVPIKLNDMQVNMIHHGKYLQCRTVLDPFYSSSMVVLVADDDKQVETVYIYNYFATVGFTDRDPGQLLPSGTHMVIKEPYLKLMVDGNYNIRVDSPTDIVILPQLVDLNNNINKAIGILDTVESLIAKGNQFFAKGSYHLAIQVYSQVNMSREDGQSQKVGALLWFSYYFWSLI